MKRKELNVFKYSSSTRRKKNSYTYIQTSDFTYKIYVDYLGIPRYFIKYKKKKNNAAISKFPPSFFIITSSNSFKYATFYRVFGIS